MPPAPPAGVLLFGSPPDARLPLAGPLLGYLALVLGVGEFLQRGDRRFLLYATRNLKRG